MQHKIDRVVPILNFFTGIESRYFRSSTQDRADCFTCDLFTSGDYSGGDVQASNRRVLLKDEKLCERLGITELCEAYSTDTLLFPIDALKDDELLDILVALTDYPALDNEDVSEMSREMEDESLESYGIDEFRKQLQTDLSEDEYEKVDNMTFDEVKDYYYRCAQHTNYDTFIVESGTSVYFDFKCFGGLYDKRVEVFKNELHK